eukprot:7779634-Karenia_brevis.AAC.1
MMVVIDGLTGRLDLNGLPATVIFDEKLAVGGERVAVHVDQSGEEIHVKQANLKAISASK